MDRLGLLEVWCVLAHDFGLYGIRDRLHQMGFKPGPALCYSSLDDGQKTFYHAREDRAAQIGPWDRKIPIRA